MAKADILIVEDDRIVAKDIQNSLEKLGFAVSAVVSSGEEAFAKAEERRPDLVFMDIMLMNDMDGIEAAGQIYSQFNIPVVYLTAYADEKVLERAKITEPFGYIIKPFVERELHSAVEIALYKHKMEKKVKESEEWLSTTLRSIGEAVIATDRKGYVTLMNPVAQTLTGWNREEAMGRPVKEVFNIIDEKTGKRVEDPVGKVIREGRVVGLGNHSALIARDGTEISIDQSGAPIRDKKGEIIGVVLDFRDIRERKRAEEALQKAHDELEQRVEERTAELTTANEQLTQKIEEHKKSEKALRESEERYRKAIEHSNDGVAILKGDQHIFVNQRFMDIFGYEEPKELIGKPLSMTVHPDDLEKVTDFALRRQKGETVPSRYEAKGIRKDGDTIYIEASVTRTTYRGEAVSLAYLRDITERKRAEQEKIILQKMSAMGTLTAGIAHELNNPMMGMLNFIQYCLKYTSKDDRRYTVLEDTERETKRCIDIVGNLLTFSRVEKEDEEEYKKESLPTVFDRVFKLLSYRIEKENVLLSQKYLEETPEICIKVSNIQQVFLNLMGNAMDAVKESKKKEIHVEIRPEGEFVHVTVADSGYGIAPEKLQNIFDPFFTTKPSGQGTGLGLSVCHSIVRAHGGEITCESEVGAGTKFNVLLPVDKRGDS